MREGIRLGRYVLGRRLGRGASGVVHEAVLEGPGGLRKPVVLKLMTRGGGRLQREARLGGLLRHSGLVDVYEVGESDGVAFCAMERCASSLAPHAPLPPRAVVEVGLAVCDALGYAHRELGLVHLDLKPDNLLLTDQGAVKVADLGIARASGFESDGRVRGTPGYMAPEQAAGAPVDGRADVYALGVTLLVLATGQPPRAPDTFDPLISTGSATLVGSPETPDWLAPVVDRCLCADPADRWPDLDAVATALRALRVPGMGLAAAVGWRPPPDPAPQTGLEDEPEPVFGRDDDLRVLAGALATPGAVALVGPPGAGKSRLAREAARRLQLPGWCVDLSAVVTHEGVRAAVARAVGRDEIGRALALRGASVVVLDNVDAVGAEVVDLVADWSSEANEVRWLLTSRAFLGSGIRHHAVHPLAEPAAIELLAARARVRGAEVADHPRLGELARRLDGLPLALELAAGRLGVLSVDDVLERLDLGLLRAATSDRHGTLAAALEWSWTLLEPAERAALAQLSVFRGSFAHEAVEDVVRLDGAASLEVLEALLDHSLVHAVAPGRLRLLSSVRAFAREHVADPEVEVRHGRYYATRAAAGRAPDPADLEDLTWACRRAVDRSERALAVQLLEALWPLQRRVGPYAAALALAEDVVALSARAHAIAGAAARLAGHLERALEHLDVAETTARAQGDRRGEAIAQDARGRVPQDLGRAGAAAEAYEAARAGFHAIGDADLEATTIGNLGRLAWRRGALDEATERYERALAMHREAGDRFREGIVLGNLSLLRRDRSGLEEALAIHREVGDARSEAIVLGNLGVVAHEEGRLDDARVHYEEALAVHVRIGDRSSEATFLGNLGAVEAASGDHDAARQHFEKALRLHRAVGDRRTEGVVLGHLGSLERKSGQLERAVERFRAALAAHREAGNDRGELGTLTNLGATLIELGDPAAREVSTAALALAERLGDGTLAARLRELIGQG